MKEIVKVVRKEGINELKNVIEEAIKDHCLFRQNEVINFTSKIEELLKDYIEKELTK